MDVPTQRPKYFHIGGDEGREEEREGEIVPKHAGIRVVLPTRISVVSVVTYHSFMNDGSQQ